MENSGVLVHNGCLIFVHQSETGIELEGFRFNKQTDFSIEFVSKSTLGSNCKHWKIEAVGNIVDDRNGVEAPVIMVSSDSRSNDGKWFCVIQTTWNGNSVINYRHSDTDADNDTLAKSKVQFVPLMEFTCTGSVSASSFCSLLYGPRVLIAEQTRLSLFSHGPDSKTKTFVQDFCVRPIENGTDRTDSHKEPESAILCVISEENWIVTVLKMQERVGTTIITVVALERNSESGHFRINALRTRHFLPQDYSPKVSSVLIHHCQRTETVSGVYVYKNSCAVGLNDGYVLTFSDGIVLSCFTPWTHVDAVYPAFAVINLLEFGSGIFVCQTDTKHCFIVDETTKQVKNHWEEVDRALVGDFLHRGGQQLLLLFSTHEPQQPPEHYLLTDLQGFVVDGRNSSTSLASLSEDSCPTDDDETSKNLQPVVNALQEQNQTLARSVAEEKHRLACKQLFVRETWGRLLNLSLCGGEEVGTVSPAEVPLVSLKEGDQHKKLASRKQPLVPEPPEDIQVQCLWHRLVDSTCVVGARIFNASERELFSSALTVTPSSAGQSSCHHSLSVTSRVWQCFQTNSPSSTAPPPDSAPCKRQKVESRLHVRQTQVIQPSESVTVTCAFDAADLAWCGKMVFHVHLTYAVREQKSFWTSHCQGDVTGPGDSCVTLTNFGEGSEKDEGGESRCGERGDAHSWSLPNRERRKSAACGEVALQVSELLRPDERRLCCLREAVENGREKETDLTQFEEELLALNSVQQQWACDISFVLHEASEVVPQFLHAAGFVFSPQFGQFFMPLTAPKCLHWVRVQLLGFQPLPHRAASVLVFARDSSQFLLVLRHLYSHLPYDSTVTLATDHSSPDLQHLAKLMFAELSERKRQARVALDAQKSAPSQKGSLTVHKSQRMEEGAVSDDDSNSAAQTLQRKEGGIVCDVLPTAEMQSEEFGEQQRLYHQRQTCIVRKEDIARFKAALQECEAETDMAVAKMKL